VSHSPEQASAAAQIAGRNTEYAARWQQISNLVASGNSWSGHERNQCFLNTRDGQFASIGSLVDFDLDMDARSCALSDWDHDGDLDVWLTSRNAPMVRMLRNDISAAHHYLSVRLVGTRCNRDAIGARLEVLRSEETSDLSLIGTVRAGNGFLSQSSKSLHFGLGSHQEVVDVVITWPDGSQQRHKAIKPDAHYVIVQGADHPRRWQRPEPANLSKPKKQEFLSSGHEGRVALSVPISLPPLSYLAASGESVDLARGSDNNRLVCLWASWCPPCVAELKVLAQHQNELRAASIDIVALSVDQITMKPIAASNEADRLLHAIAFPFSFGDASEQFVDTFQAVHDQLFLRPQSPILPTSFLINKQGQLVAIYRGPVTLHQVIDDVHLLCSDVAGDKVAGDSVDLRNLPFSGKFLGAVPQLRPASIARRLIDRGYADVALVYLDRKGEKFIQDEYLARIYGQLSRVLIDDDRHQDAIAALARAVAISPQLVPLQVNLAVSLEQQGHAADAIVIYNEVLRRKPNHAVVHNNLAWLLATHEKETIRDGKAAVQHALEAAQATQYEQPEVLETLAAAFAEAGEYPKAVEAAQRAAKLADAKSLRQLAVNLRIQLDLYRQQKPFRVKTTSPTPGPE